MKQDASANSTYLRRFERICRVSIRKEAKTCVRRKKKKCDVQTKKTATTMQSTYPSADPVASFNPQCLGANSTQVTAFRASVSCAFAVHREAAEVAFVRSSKIFASWSEPQVAMRLPNSGWPQLRLLTLPLWACHSPTRLHSPLSVRSQTRTKRSPLHVAIRRP